MYLTKGQIISKGLFGVLEFSQKTNEQIRRSSKNEFVRSFFGRIRGYQKSFRNYLTFSKGDWLRIFFGNPPAEVQSNQKTFCFRLWFLHIRGKISRKFIWKWTLTHSQLKFQRLIFLPIWHFYCDDLWIQMKRWSCMLCLISKD